MPSASETALMALEARLALALGAWTAMWTSDSALAWGLDDGASMFTDGGGRLERNLEEVAEPPAGGLIVLRDGDPGEPDITMSPRSYAYEHQADLEVYVRAPAAADRAAALDRVLVEIGRFLKADPKLGGAVEFCRPEAATTMGDPFARGAPVTSALVPVLLAYVTSDPLG